MTHTIAHNSRSALGGSRRIVEAAVKRGDLAVVKLGTRGVRLARVISSSSPKDSNQAHPSENGLLLNGHGQEKSEREEQRSRNTGTKLRLGQMHRIRYQSRPSNLIGCRAPRPRFLALGQRTRQPAESSR